MKEKQVEFHHDKTLTALQQLSALVGRLDLQCLKHLVKRATQSKNLSAIGQ